MTEGPIVCNAGPLIALSIVGHLEFGPCEAAVIATAHGLKARLALIAERRARRVAERWAAESWQGLGTV